MRWAPTLVWLCSDVAAVHVKTPTTTTSEYCVGGRSIRLRQRVFQGSVRQRSMNNFGDATGTAVWPAALPVAEYLTTSLVPAVASRLGLKRPLRVLELGAGCGLVGIALAASGCSVTLTDMRFSLPGDDGETTLSWLEQNVALNRGLIEAHGGEACCAPLAWGAGADADALRAADHRAGFGFDLVVGSDILYFPEAYPALLKTITAFAGTSSEAAEATRRRRRDGSPADRGACVAAIGYNVRNGAELKFGTNSDFVVLHETVHKPTRPGKNPTSKTVSLFVPGSEEQPM